MNLKNILWVRNTGNIRPKAPIADNLFGLKLSGGGGVITTATGNPVSIETNKAQNALDLQIAFSPKQSGSGTPSPDNIRPIVPWTALTLTKNGVDTSYSLGDSYYGGTLDVVTGVLTVTHEILTIDENSGATVASIGGVWYVDSLIPRIDGEWQKLSICDSFVRKNEAYANTSGFKTNTSIGDFAGCSQNGRYDRVFFHDERFTTNEELNEYLAENSVTISKELDEPQTVSLTPAEVALLAGNNTLATDGGAVTVTYMAKRG